MGMVGYLNPSGSYNVCRLCVYTNTLLPTYPVIIMKIAYG